MSAPSSASPVGNSNQAQASTPTPAQPAGAAPGYTSTTQIHSLGQLKEVAPDVYKAMMQGIAQTIVNDMNEHQERLKKMMQEARQQSES